MSEPKDLPAVLQNCYFLCEEIKLISQNIIISLDLSFTIICVYRLPNISVNEEIAKSDTKQLKQLTDNYSFTLGIQGTVRVTNKSKRLTTMDLMLMSQGPVIGGLDHPMIHSMTAVHCS